MFKCKWKKISDNSWRTSCSPWPAFSTLDNIHSQLFKIVYCSHCGKKIKVVEE